MKKVFNIYFYIFYFIINISFSFSQDFQFDLIQQKNNLNPLYIEYNDVCQKWTPSLLSPISLIFKTSNTNYMKKKDISIKFKNPFFSPYEFEGELYDYLSNKFLGHFNTLVAIDKRERVSFCQMGLSVGFQESVDTINEDEYTLNYLIKEKKIEAKIFSFDKWDVLSDQQFIKSFFYLGKIHKNFNSKEGIVGTCQNNKEDAFWGCSFKEMIFINSHLPLKKGDKLYKIYFASELIDIIFPIEFSESFKNSANQMCLINKKNQRLECEKSLFNKEGYIPLKLINDKMNITVEIDYLNRYNTSIEDADEKIMTNIKFDSLNDNITFPMIMFKNFHVQFDAESDTISFYTNNKTILEVEKIEEPKNENSSLALTVFLIILIIILIIAILFGIFYFIRKRRGNIEKNINRFTKFEDEEDFKNMNENKVY